MSDLHPRIWTTEDNKIFLYHPIMFELVDGDDRTSYIIDWGKTEVNSRLEFYLLDREDTAVFDMFVKPSSKASQLRSARPKGIELRCSRDGTTMARTGLK